jgi:hypothetical protein
MTSHLPGRHQCCAGHERASLLVATSLPLRASPLHSTSLAFLPACVRSPCPDNGTRNRMHLRPRRPRQMQTCLPVISMLDMILSLGVAKRHTFVNRGAHSCYLSLLYMELPVLLHQ